jgi:hypothetical protein
MNYEKIFSCLDRLGILEFLPNLSKFILLSKFVIITIRIVLVIVFMNYYNQPFSEAVRASKSLTSFSKDDIIEM